MAVIVGKFRTGDVAPESTNRAFRTKASIKPKYSTPRASSQYRIGVALIHADPVISFRVGSLIKLAAAKEQVYQP